MVILLEYNAYYTHIYIYYILTQYIPGMFQLSRWSGIHWDIMYEIYISKQPNMCHAQDTGLMFLQKVITIPLVTWDTMYLYTWWLIPLSKWLITPIISGLTLLIPFITGVITHLLSGMSHQVLYTYYIYPLRGIPTDDGMSSRYTMS